MTDEPWLDSKRLVGAHLAGDFPGAMLEVSGDGPEFDLHIERWQSIVKKLFEKLDWQSQPIRVRRHHGGALLVIGAPIDLLYTATEVNEQAWIASLDSATGPPRDVVDTLSEAAASEADPGARRLHEAALSAGVVCMVDEDGVSLGTGKHVRHFSPRHAPDPATVDFTTVTRVPTAVITGTNGKTTTARMLGAMVTQAGYIAGITSTDRIEVGGETVDRGDYSGPGGARRLLRDSRVEIAILETARGGLLRRGLAVGQADVAIITNIAEDHLGDGGVDDLDALADVKFLVTRALDHDAAAVLNWDDPRLRQRAEKLDCRIIGVALDSGPPPTDSACWLAGDTVMLRIDSHDHSLICVNDMPSSLHGHARHNVANAMAAAAGARALGLPLETIRDTLRTFGENPADNPGRAEHHTLDGVHYLVDFAHNPHGFEAVLRTARGLAGGRLAVCFGQAGDRSDSAIVDLARAAFAAGCDHYVIKEMAEYRRGRAEGDIPRLLRQTLEELGVDSAAIEYASTEPEAAARLRRWAQADDVIALFIHSDRDAVLAALTV